MMPLLPSTRHADYETGTIAIEHSGWLPEQHLAMHEGLADDIDTDIAVIGSGLAGASLSLHLAERGVKVVTLEARQPGNGASGRNAGHVQTFLENLEPLHAWGDRGKRFAAFFMEHRNIVFDLCAKHGIDGDAVKSGMVEAAYRPHTALAKKAALWKAFGYNVDIVTAASLRELLGTEKYRYGIHWREGGRVNPYLFTNGMISAAVRHGARVFGDSPVIGCHREGQRWRVDTARGSLRAQRIVICTNGHAGNLFFPELARTQYPLVACGMATKPLSPALLDIINPARVAMTHYPTGLYPMVIDGRNRLVTATIPHPCRAHDAKTYFAYFLRYLHRIYPQTRNFEIELGAYWTGITANSSSVYHADYPKLYQVDDGVLALMNLGTWGNVMGPQLGLSLAQSLASERLDDCVLPLERPEPVRFQRLFEFKTRHLMIPVARVIDRINLA
ncbi:FAD-binding oxidoreductase (plasmid) [Cupriavidus necator]|uniref:FAD-binding oxidoreductase n=1 Tax=Cupriavidus necator TaxID=106590 RepID=A0A367P8F9_CUPNE|nr:FAD-dependent oxidoreductase [Cupriavidus necator]QQX89156.1 FAD-binding oxidoreductase [Cupriavidus necator]RCJ04129.1 FAD-binding oxidoreductase [Cupriavidus necator]